jgi:hypothetical protein
MERRTKLLLLDARENTFPASRAGFLKAFSSQQDVVYRYLRSGARQHNRVRFDNVEDVRQMLVFCNHPPAN